MPTKEEVYKVVKKVLEKDENVLLAYLFGSVARNNTQPVSDVDVAVLFMDDSLEKQADTLWKIAKALHIPEDKIDLVNIGRAGIYLKYNILSQGIKFVDKGFEGELIRELVEHYPEAKKDFDVALKAWLKDPSIYKAVVSKRIDEVQKNAAIIRERYANRSVEWVLDDAIRALALERAVERIVGAMMDICRHVVSAKGLGLIETYAEYPLRLVQHQLMPKALAEKVAELIKLRNVLAHRYLEVDYTKLHKKAKEIAERVAPSFVEWVKGFLSSELSEGS